jgi:hypothetical protein
MKTSNYFGQIYAEDGLVLALVLVFTGALLLLGTALISTAANEKLIATYQAQDIRKHYLAEAGLEAGLAVLQHDFNSDLVLTGNLMDGSYLVTFEGTESANRKIRSAGTIDNFTLELVIDVELNPDGTITSGEWKRL